MIRVIRTKTLQVLRGELDDLRREAGYQKRRADMNSHDIGDLSRKLAHQANRTYDYTGEAWVDIAGRLRGELKAAQAVADAASREAVRLSLHNQALRDALTALGGAVIELQDHIEVNQ